MPDLNQTLADRERELQRKSPADMAGKFAWAQKDAEAMDDRDDGIRFFQGVFNVLAFVLVIAAFVGLYLVTP